MVTTIAPRSVPASPMAAHSSGAQLPTWAKPGTPVRYSRRLDTHAAPQRVIHDPGLGELANRQIYTMCDERTHRPVSIVRVIVTTGRYQSVHYVPTDSIAELAHA